MTKKIVEPIDKIAFKIDKKTYHGRLIEDKDLEQFVIQTDFDSFVAGPSNKDKVIRYSNLIQIWKKYQIKKE